MEVEKIIARLKSHLGIESNKQLSEYLGVDNSTISRWKKGKSVNLKPIVEKVQDIDYNWLLNGEQYLSNPSYIGTKSFINKLNRNLSVPVVLIPEKAKAGYLADFSTDSVEELPTFAFKDYTDGHRYRAFEIEGNSMETNFFAGDVLLCEKLEQITQLKPNKVYILHTEEGLLCKRFKEKKKESIVLQSDNPNYENISINIQNIVELWYVISLHRQF